MWFRHPITLLPIVLAACLAPGQTPDGRPDADGECTKVIPAGVGTLQTQLDALRPGDVLCLRGGVYATGARFGTAADRVTFGTSGKPEAYVSLTAYRDEQPVIRGQFRITGNYLKISKLRFEGPLNPDQASPTARRDNLVEFRDNHHVIFLQNEVTKSDYHAGIYLARVNHVSITDCVIHHNGRFGLERDPKTGAKTINVDHGIYWGSTSGGGNIVANNRIYANRGYGLHIYPRAYDITVVGNRLFANGNSGIIIAGKSDRITVSGNSSVLNESNPQIRVRSGHKNVIFGNQTWAKDEDLAGIQNWTLSDVRDNQIAEPDWQSFPELGNHK